MLSFLLSLCLNAGLAAVLLFWAWDAPREHVFMLTALGEEALEMEPGGAVESAAAPAKARPEIAEERVEPPPPERPNAEREIRAEAFAALANPWEPVEGTAPERAPLEQPAAQPEPPASRRPKRQPPAEPELAETPPASTTPAPTPAPLDKPLAAPPAPTPPTPEPPAPAAEASRLGADRRVLGVSERARAQPALTPRYPAASRRRGETGVVRVRARIGADGRCLDASVETSSGYAALDQAALDAVRRASYIPSRVDGAPVTAEEVFLVDFRLR